MKFINVTDVPMCQESDGLRVVQTGSRIDFDIIFYAREADWDGLREHHRLATHRHTIVSHLEARLGTGALELGLFTMITFSTLGRKNNIVTASAKGTYVLRDLDIL